MVGPTEIAAMLGVSRGRANQLLARQGFPAPIATLSTGRVWSYDHVAAWAAETNRTLYDITAG